MLGEKFATNGQPTSGQSISDATRGGALGGLIASAASIAVLAAVAPSFFEPFVPALLALIVAHVLGGAVVAALGAALLPRLRRRRTGCVVALLVYGACLAPAFVLHATPTPSTLAIVAACLGGAALGVGLAAVMPLRAGMALALLVV